MEKFKNYESIAAALIGLSTCIIFYFLPLGTWVPSWTLALAISAIFFVFWILLIWRANFKKNLEKNLTFKATIISLKENHDLLFSVNIQNVLAIESYFVIYCVIDGFEKIAGCGYVTNIQNNGIIQAEIDLGSNPEEYNIYNANLIIKPTITYPVIKTTIYHFRK